MKVVIANKPGQLGNRLFIFSHWIAYAMETGATIYNPAFDDYAPYFTGTRGQVLPRFPLGRNRKRLSGKYPIVFAVCYILARILHRLRIVNRFVGHIYLDWEDRCDLETDKLPRSRWLFVQGWLFRAPNWLRKHRQDLLPVFEPAEPHRSAVREYLSRTRSRYGTVIGVHIRRGDYRTFEGGKYYYSMEQYARQIRALLDQPEARHAVFVLCSNEPLDLKAFEGLPCQTAPGHLIEDLYILAGCDYIVGPPSTYTMWASFYGGVPMKHIHDPDVPARFHEFKPYASA